jgi:thiamine-monophosphate kinase
MLVEGVHFERATHPPEIAGRKALARGLSDIAAMGAKPRFCLLSLALPPRTEPAWVDAFFRGLLRFRVPLAGGDLARARMLTADIVVCGALPRGTALRRDTARAGDAIFVSGRLGGSALGLETRSGAAWQRHLRPQPRLALGWFLRGRATACMDLSDGLSLDLHRLAEASHLTAEITAPPIFPGATLAHALHGGEDYELLFTAPPAAIPARLGALPLARIGTMRKGKAGMVLFEQKPLALLGYDHFARSRAHS